MHKAATGFVTGAYGEEEFWRDLLGVTGGATNERLARLTIRESETLGDWMPANGVRWQKPLRGTLFFAGEAADSEGATGTVHGAIASGRRAARQTLRSL